MAPQSKSSTAKAARAKKGGKTTTKKKSGGGGKKKPILDCLAELCSMGIKVAQRDQVIALSGYPKNSFMTLIGILKKKGQVDYDNKTIQLTQKGIKEVGAENLEAPIDPEAMHARIMETYVKGKTPTAIYELLKDGVARTREQIAKHVGCTNMASLGTHLSAMKSAGVLEYLEEPAKTVRLSDFCFPFGRT